MNEWNSALPLLDRLEILSKMIDREMDGYYSTNPNLIIEFAQWQMDIISQLRQLFNHEERQISALRAALREIGRDSPTRRSEGIDSPDMKKLSAFTALTALFDQRIGRGMVDGTELRAWALTYGPDLVFDLVKALFQKEEALEDNEAQTST